MKKESAANETVKKEAVNVVKAAVAETKPVAKKTTVKTVVKKETKKPAAKKETTKASEKKPSVKKETTKATVQKVKKEPKTKVQIQFGGRSYDNEELVKIAKDVWKYDIKGKTDELSSIELYVKPEECAVYYVMNKDITGVFYI